jgi:hypothetical protein
MAPRAGGAFHDQRLNYVVGPPVINLNEAAEVGIWCSCQRPAEDLARWSRAYAGTFDGTDIQ